MSEEQLKKRPTHKSPHGEFVGWPKLTEPDTKFKEEGEYTADLRVQADKAQALVHAIDKAAAESLEEARSQESTPKGKAKWETKYLPYEIETDETGEETGFVIFKFRSRASGVSKKTKKPWKRTVPIFDSTLKRMPTKDGAYVHDIWKGSEGYVSFQIVPYAASAQTGASVKLTIEAVQITKLVSGGERDAEDFGFSTEEGGFAAAASEADEVSPTAADPEDGSDF